MYPGAVSKLSESTVTAAATIGPFRTDLVRVSGSTTIATINPPSGPGGFSGLLLLVAGTTVATTTTGNILTAVTLTAGLVSVFVYSKGLGKWVPGAIS